MTEDTSRVEAGPADDASPMGDDILLPMLSHGVGERDESPIAAATGQQLYRHLLEQRPAGDIGQLATAAVAAWYYSTLGLPGLRTMVVWSAVFVLAVVVRRQLRKRLPGSPSDTVRALRWLRLDIWASAAMWTVLAFLLIGAPPTDWLVLTLLMSGLSSSATSSFIADRSAYAGYSALMFVPLLTLPVLTGLGPITAAIFVLVGFLHWPYMFGVLARSNRLLTDSIRTNLLLEASQEAAARDRDFLRSVMSSAPVPIIIATFDGRVLGCNPAFRELTGYEPAEIFEGGFFQKVTPKESQKRLAGWVARTREGAAEQAEIRLVAKNGQDVWVRVSGGRVHEPGENVTVIAAEDMTDEVRTRTALIRAREAAEESERLKSAFVANVSHDLRTPLNSVIGFATLLEEHGELDERQQRQVGHIRSAGEELLGLVDEVLDFSRIEDRRSESTRTSVRIRDYIEDRVAIAQETARGRDVSISPSFDQAAFDASMHVDERGLNQILNNLLSNAVKFTPDGGHVTLGVRVGDREVEILVEDDGPGVPLEDRDRIFDRFERGSNAQGLEGTGIGLFLARYLAKEQGGTLALDEPREGAGATFRLTLPLESDAETGQILA